MQRFLLFCAMALTCASLAWGQDNSTQPGAQSPASSAATATATSSIQGCLGGTTGNYVLTQDNTGTTFKLSGDDSTMKDHVGHEVQVSGQLVASNGSGGDQEQTSTGNSPAANAINAIQVTGITMVADHCNSGSGSAPPSASNTSENSSDTSADSGGGAATAATQDNGSSPPSAGTSAAADPGNGASAGNTPENSTSSGSQAQESSPRNQENASSASQTQGDADKPAAKDAAAAKENGEKLPRTASDLPSLAILGVIFLAAGLASTTRRRPKRETDILG